MLNHIVFNEESLPFETIEDCENGLDVFFSILHETALQKVAFSTIDECTSGWASLNFGADFVFGDWLNNSLDKEEARQVISVMNTIPCPFFAINAPRMISGDNFLFVLSEDADREVAGLGLASLNNCSGLSFISEEVWRSDEVQIIKQWDESASVKQERVRVPNIASIEHIRKFLSDMQAQNQSHRSYFDGISATENPDFPNLMFTESVLKVLRSRSISSVNYTYIIQTLNILNLAVLESSNTTELATNSGLTITGESEPTMSNRLLKRLRSFKHPDGNVKVFEDHIKNFSDSRRMHLLADYSNNTICIGYFGPHIKTSSS